MKIPLTENTPLIRTDFSDKAAWEKLVEAASNPEDPFIFTMEIIDDRENDGASVEQLMEVVPKVVLNYGEIYVADKTALSEPGHPLLVVDVSEKRKGRRFRAIAREVAAIDNNLSIANMGFEEFAECVDETGVFRGIPGP